MILQLATPPAEAPVAVSEAKEHIRLAEGIEADDGTVGAFIDAAVGLLEGFTNRAFVSRTYDLVFDEPPADGVVELLRAPIASVTGVYTTDEDGVEEAIDADVYLAAVASGRVMLRRGQSWPYSSTLQEADAFRVRYVAGYGGAEDVPEPVKQAIKVQVAEWYENRGDEPDVGTGSTQSAGASIVLGENAKSIVRAAGLIRYVV